MSRNAHFRKRIVRADRAACLDGYAAAIGFGDLHFSVCAPTVSELRSAWEMLQKADPRVQPLDEARIQHVGIVDRSAVEDVPR